MIGFLDFFARVVHQSFYKRELYAEAAHAWRGRGFSILIFGAFLMALVQVALSLSLFSNERIAAVIADQTPTFSIENGVMAMESPSPHTMRFDELSAAVVFDADEALSRQNNAALAAKMRKENIAVLVLNNRLLASAGKDELHVQAFSDLRAPVRVNPISASATWELVQRIGPLVVGMAAWFSFIVYIVFKQMLFSGVVWLSMREAQRLPFASVQRVVSCALIPSSVIVASFWWFGISIPAMISTLIAVAYIIFALRAVRS